MGLITIQQRKFFTTRRDCVTSNASNVKTARIVLKMSRLLGKLMEAGSLGSILLTGVLIFLSVNVHANTKGQHLRQHNLKHDESMRTTKGNLLESNGLNSLHVIHGKQHVLHRKKGSAVVDENRMPGSLDWFLPQQSTSPLIEGFTTSFSHYPGDAVQFKLDCRRIPRRVDGYQLQIYRMGYYNGTGARLVDSLPILSTSCSTQPDCLFEQQDRMTTCKNWDVSAEWTIPSNIVSGVFVALPTVVDREPTPQSWTGGYIPFVVKQERERKHASEMLFKTSDLTWVAYNKYGGWNVYYRNDSKDFATRATMASYDRPFANRLQYPIGQQQNFLFSTEFPMLFWLEKHGYDVSYASCGDIEELFEESRLFDHRVLLSVGHDEYWTPLMRKAFLEARDFGVNLAFFSGNEMFWRVIWQENYHPDLPFDVESMLPAGFMGKLVKKKGRFRSFVCRKESIGDVTIWPRSEWWTGTFIDPRYRIPEPSHVLTGQVFAANAYRHEAMTIGEGFSQLRMWRDTSVRSFYQNFTRGNRVSNATYHTPIGILGYELDELAEDLFAPPGMFSLSSTKLFIRKALVDRYGAVYNRSGWLDHRMSLYRHHLDKIKDSTEHVLQDMHQVKKSRGLDHCSHIHDKHDDPLASGLLHTGPSYHHHVRSSLVFAAGTMQWSWALSSFHDGERTEQDFNLHQATLNLFADMHVLPYGFRGYLNANDGYGNVMPQPQQLVFPSLPKDKIPPVSRINQDDRTHNHSSTSSNLKSSTLLRSISLHKKSSLTITGTALDLGTGRVAAVEVSVDAGKTWHTATGREHWTYTHQFHKTVENTQSGFRVRNDSYPYPAHGSNSDVYLLRDTLTKQSILFDASVPLPVNVMTNSARSTLMRPHEGEHAKPRHHSRLWLIISRAVDDSGWVESIDAQLDSVLCSVATISAKGHTKLLNRLPHNMVLYQVVD
jgi:hypothetical protein